MKSKLFPAIATLTGTVIGAGFLGIPYVIAKSGFAIGLVHMVVISFMMLIINLIMGEIILSTNKIHHIPGYTSKYLGIKTKLFVFLISIFGLYAALTAYLLGEGDSLSFIFTGAINYSFIAGIVFWLLVAFISFRGIRSFKKIEPLAVIAVFVVILILGVVNFDKIDVSNLATVNTSFMFFPFGVVLFAFLGISAIPEMKRVLISHTKLLKRAIIIGSLIPLVVYIIFAIIVLGLHGTEIAEVATMSLGKVVTLLGIFTMFTAFLALNLALQDTFRFDFSLGFIPAWVLATVVPLGLFILVKIYNWPFKKSSLYSVFFFSSSLAIF